MKILPKITLLEFFCRNPIRNTFDLPKPIPLVIHLMSDALLIQCVMTAHQQWTDIVTQHIVSDEVIAYILFNYRLKNNTKKVMGLIWPHEITLTLSENRYIAENFHIHYKHVTFSKRLNNFVNIGDKSGLMFSWKTTRILSGVVAFVESKLFKVGQTVDYRLGWQSVEEKEHYSKEWLTQWVTTQLIPLTNEIIGIHRLWIKRILRRVEIILNNGENEWKTQQ